jgi:hypothetical protein
MSQLGHEDPTFTMRVYTHLVGRSEAETEALIALIEGAELPLKWRERREPAKRRIGEPQQESGELTGNGLSPPLT